MALDTQTVKKQYTLTEPFASEFAIDFPYWDAEDIYAILTTPDGDVDLVQETDFTVSEADGVSGTLTRVSDWDDGARLTIYRSMTRQQLIDLANGGRIDANVLEKMVDKITAMVQELAEQIGRTVMFYPITDEDEAGTFPAKEQRAGKFLAFDIDGKPSAVDGAAGSYPVTDFMATVLDDADAAAARATLGVNKTNIDALGIDASSLNGEDETDFHDASQLAGVAPLSAIPDNLIGKNAETADHATDADTLAETAPSAFALTLLDDADAAAARATLGVNKTNIDALGIDAESVSGMKVSTFEIGSWNMDATGSVTVATGLTANKIRSVSITVTNDAQTSFFNPYVNQAVDLGINTYSNGNITVYRRSSGYFDSSSFAGTGFNRGWLTVVYVN